MSGGIPRTVHHPILGAIGQKPFGESAKNLDIRKLFFVKTPRGGGGRVLPTKMLKCMTYQNNIVVTFTLSKEFASRPQKSD